MADNDNTFDFELVSPEAKLMSEKAWQVTIPGEEGDFGVRAQHSALVSTIRPGVVEIISKQGDAPVRIFIAGGFADVTARNCTILAEEATMVSDFNADEIKSEIADLEKKLSDAKDNIEIARYTKQLSLSKAKLNAIAA
ncbi:MAG: ATP synthase F1 subunit epsilon [Alphaproteobacteria bacterium]|nr:ATP synthase F1 subunit epsilon [Alphaproteobacteria bacterium]NCQ89060.1 ATP synthase F1 subunit epsilon [Alphaproteobacteria bacterium]NCT07960.1 ATP synthase F1 subunit epsilon [Alphaproteobacteria bacterium]